MLYLSQKYCDNSLYEFPSLRSRLEKDGVRSLLLEVDGSTATIGQARTRIEAFLEVL